MIIGEVGSENVKMRENENESIQKLEKRVIIIIIKQFLFNALYYKNVSVRCTKLT